MKNTVLLTSIFFIFIAASGSAHQIFCKTPDGRGVILDSNGTWKYDSEKMSKVDAKSAKFIRSKKVPFGVWFDPNVWTVSKKKINADSEFEFSLKNDDTYAFLINEKVGLSYDLVKSALFNQLESFGERVSLITEEKRIVNGLPIRYLEIEIEVKGVLVSYMLYILVGDEETIQLGAFSTGKQRDQNKPVIEKFLNGLSRA